MLITANSIVRNCGVGPTFDAGSPDPFRPFGACHFSGDRFGGPLFVPDADEGSGSEEETVEETVVEEGEEVVEATIPKRQYDSVMKETRQRKRTIAERDVEIVRLTGLVPNEDELAEFRDFQSNKENEEVEKKKSAGRFEELLSTANKKHAAEIGALDKTVAGLTARLGATTVRSALASVIPQYTGAPVADVIAMIGDGVSFDAEEDAIVLKGPDGEWPLNDSGKTQSLEEFVEKFIAGKSYLVKVEPLGGSGGKNQRVSGKTGARLTGAQINALPLDEKRSVLKSIREGNENAIEAFKRN